LTTRKFIKLSIHLIKYFHQALVEKLSKYKLNDENVTNILEDLEDILDNLSDPIVYLSNKSIQFCNYFHEEESENGVKVLFDLPKYSFLKIEYLKYSTLIIKLS
jgi:hypothetical protein